MDNRVQRDFDLEEYDDISASIRTGARKPEQVAAIVAFLKNLDFFKEMTSEMVVPIVEHLKLFELDEKTVICKEGDVGTIFYILIKGKIGVYKEGI